MVQFNRLKGNGTSEDTMKRIYILIGSMIGSMAGSELCGGAWPCQMLGGRIGAVLTCLSVTKEVYEGVEKAISTLKDSPNQAGDIGQTALNAITTTANSVDNGVKDAMTKISNGVTSDAVNALKGATNEVGQAFVDFGNVVIGGLEDATKKLEDVGKDIQNGLCSVFGC